VALEPGDTFARLQFEKIAARFCKVNVRESGQGSAVERAVGKRRLRALPDANGVEGHARVALGIAPTAFIQEREGLIAVFQRKIDQNDIPVKLLARPRTSVPGLPPPNSWQRSCRSAGS